MIKPRERLLFQRWRRGLMEQRAAAIELVNKGDDSYKKAIREINQQLIMDIEGWKEKYGKPAL